MDYNKQKSLYNEFNKMIRSFNESLPRGMRSFFKETPTKPFNDLSETKNSLLLEHTLLNTKVVKIINKLNIYALKDINKINLKAISNLSNITPHIIDEILDLLTEHDLTTIIKPSFTRIKNIEIPASLRKTLYQMGIYYLEDLENIDLSLFISTDNCQTSVLDNIIDLLYSNNIPFLQKEDGNTLISKSDLSPVAKSLLYRSNIFYNEDIAGSNLINIFQTYNCGPAAVNDILSYIAENKIECIQYKANYHKLNDFDLSYETLSLLYKNGIYFYEDFAEIKITNLSNLIGISPKIIDNILDFAFNEKFIDFMPYKEKQRIKDLDFTSPVISALYKVGVYFTDDNIDINEVIAANPNIAPKTLFSIKRYLETSNSLKNTSADENITLNHKKNERNKLCNLKQSPIGGSEKSNNNFVDMTRNDNTINIGIKKEIYNNENQEDHIYKKLSIDNCQFSIRVKNGLLRKEIKTVFDLAQLSDNELLRLPNFGKGSVNEVREFFEKCENDKSFWLSVLAMNNLPTTSFIKRTTNKTSESNTKTENSFKAVIEELPNEYYESVLNIEGLSNKAIQIFKLNNIRKLGQLIQYELDSLFFDNAEYRNVLEQAILNDDCIIGSEYKIFDEDIKIIREYLKSKGIEYFPIKLSIENNKKLMYFTVEETKYYGWANIIFTLLNESFELLKPNAKEVLFNRNGIYCEPKTLEEVGEIFGVTRERIRQIESKSLGKIKKFLSSSGYLDVVNAMTTQLLENVGSVYKIRNIEGMKNYLKLINKIGGFNFVIDEEFFWVSLKENWQDEIRKCLFNSLERDNKFIGTTSLFKDYFCEILKEYLNTDTEFQIENFNSIVEDFMQDFTHNYLIRVDNEENFKVARNKIRSNSGKITTDYRNEEIIALFEKMYPDGVHLPIDKDNILKANLKPLLDSIPYKMSIRTLSDGVLKNAPNIILWDKGLYIHVNNINIKWSVVDDVINEILSEFDRGLGHFSIKKIYDKQNEEMQFAGIPNPDALIGLITYKNNPRIGHRKLEVFDTFDDIPDDLSKTEIIENYLKDKGDWVSVKDMQRYFCDEIGWEDYQIEQYVGGSIYAKKDTKLGFIHMKSLIAKLNKQKLQELLELLYNQTDFSKEPIKLEAIRRSSFNKNWIEILGCDVTGNFMSDFIDSLTLKNLPLIFYQGSVYPESFVSEDLVAKCNLNNVLNYFNTRDLDKVYSEFQHFDKDTLTKIIGSDIKITTVLFGKSYEEICNYFYTQNIQDLGVLLFFPYNSIEFKKKFSNHMIKKVVRKIYSWIEAFELKQDKSNVAPSITDIFWSN